MGRHSAPSAGSTPEGTRGQKPSRAEISQMSDCRNSPPEKAGTGGATLPTETSKLWGWRSGKKP